MKEIEQNYINKVTSKYSSLGTVHWPNSHPHLIARMIQQTASRTHPPWNQAVLIILSMCNACFLSSSRWPGWATTIKDSAVGDSGLARLPFACAPLFTLVSAGWPSIPGMRAAPVCWFSASWTWVTWTIWNPTMFDVTQVVVYSLWFSDSMLIATAVLVSGSWTAVRCFIKQLHLTHLVPSAPAKVWHASARKTSMYTVGAAQALGIIRDGVWVRVEKARTGGILAGPDQRRDGLETKAS